MGNNGRAAGTGKNAIGTGIGELGNRGGKGELLMGAVIEWERGVIRWAGRGKERGIWWCKRRGERVKFGNRCLTMKGVRERTEA
jgi:hypothetical protein